MLRLCERYGRYGTYAEEAIEDDFAGDLAQRHDAALNFVRTGGRFGRKDSIAKLAARTNYFRETYAYDEPLVPGIEPFLHHEGFIGSGAPRVRARDRASEHRLREPARARTGARHTHRRAGVPRREPQARPAMADRGDAPLAPLRALAHADRDRRRLVREPGGRRVRLLSRRALGRARRAARAPQHRDPARHGLGLPRRRPGRGVARADAGPEARDAAAPARATTAGASRSGDEVLARYAFRDLRFSISWKAYCYADEAEERLVREHRDDLSRARVLEVLVADLRRRGRIADAVPNDTDLALLIIGEYIQYPPPAPAHGDRRPRDRLGQRTALRGERTARRPSYRLDAGVRPTHVDLHVELDPAASDRYRGEVAIRITLARATRRLRLHAVDLRVSRARVEAGGASAARALHAAALRRDARARARAADSRRAGHAAPRLLGPPAPRPLRPVRGALRLAPLRLHPARGDRRAQVLPLLRRAGDEGALPDRGHDGARESRALERAGRAHAAPRRAAASASPSRETPPLSTYLVALAVGPLEASAPVRLGRTPIRVWHAPGKRRLTGFALEAARASLARLERYFGLPYPYAKLDLVAVPDFEFGAMENAGAVFFRETLLLLDPATATLAERKRAAEVIAHELAHMWYGDLVTMAWWDDLWLNEAFATWMAFSVVDDWKPAWRMWHDFQHGRAAALELDALRHTHPIYCEVRTAEEANANFDLITYEKGASVVRMLERYLGPATLPARRAHLHPPPSRGQHGRVRSVARALRGLGRARRSHGPRLDRAGRAIRWCRSRARASAGARGSRSRQSRFALRRPARTPRAGRALADPVGGPRRRARRAPAPRAQAARRGARARRSRSRRPAFVYGNADEGGFFRPLHDAAGAARARRLAARALRRRAHGARRPPVGARARGTRGPRRLPRARRGARGRARSRRAARAAPAARLHRRLARPRRHARLGASATSASWRAASVPPSPRSAGSPRRGGDGDDARAPRGAARPGGRRRPARARWSPRRRRAASATSPIAARSTRTSPTASRRSPPAPAMRAAIAASSTPCAAPRRRRSSAGSCSRSADFREPEPIERTLALSLTDSRRHAGRDLPARAPAREPGGARSAPGGS